MEKHEKFLNKLKDCKNRDEARRVLASVGSRRELIVFAKTLRIFLTANDKREDVETKIIEFIVGAKLRTEAFQSLHLGR